MFDVLGRSWRLTKLSFRVIGKDKEMLLFPLLAGLFSLLFGAVLLYPTIIVGLLKTTGRSQVALGVAEYLILFVTYLGLSFIATFFNVCVVYTSRTRLAGGDATFMDSIKFAVSRLHHILAWSLLSASVGMLLRGIDHLAARAGAVGKVLLAILRSVLGMLWSITTLFVVPAMVYEDIGPIEAIRRSVRTLRATWGESLVRHYGLGLIQFGFLLLGVGLGIVLFMLLGAAGGAGLVIALAITIVYFIAVILVFSVANSVFNTALYAFANGAHPQGFDDTTLRGTFIPAS